VGFLGQRLIAKAGGDGQPGLAAARVVAMRRSVVLAAVLACVVTTPSLAAGDAQAGHRLAQQWCTGCHVVDGAAQGPDTAPSFSSIARRSAGDPGPLRAWLTAPHPPMPNLSLSRQQIDDIVAYIGSLAPR